MDQLQWFKFMCHTKDDKKVRKLTDQEYRIWTYLLCEAGEENDEGLIAQTIADIAWSIRYSENDVKNAINRLIELEMMEKTDEGYFFLNWEKNQHSPEYLRVKKARKKKKRKCNGDDNAHDNGDDNGSDNANDTTEKNRIEKNRKEKEGSLSLVEDGIIKLARVSASFQTKMGDIHKLATDLVAEYSPSYILYRMMQLHNRVRGSGRDYENTRNYLERVLADRKAMPDNTPYDQRKPEDYLAMFKGRL